MTQTADTTITERLTRELRKLADWTASTCDKALAYVKRFGDRLAGKPWGELSEIATARDTAMALPAAAKREPGVLRRQGKNAEINIRRQPPVEAQFLTAIPLARRKGGEIQKRIAHRLLELVGAHAGEKHIGHMRLDDLDRAGMKSIGLGHAEKTQLVSKRNAFRHGHVTAPLALARRRFLHSL